MRANSRVIFLFILSFILLGRQAHAEKSINWLVTHWPPWMILEGEDAGQGRFNILLNTVQQNLPQYKHINVDMNWARFWNDVSNDRNACNIFALKSGQREDVVYFSKPHTFTLPNAIIMKKSTVEKLGNPKTYSIITLLKDKRFNGVIEMHRSFTGDFDKILAANEPGSNLLRVEESAESLLKMISTGRIDYTIEYPTVAAYYSQKWHDNSSSLTSIPISEMPPFVYARLGCTKNAWGKEIIEQWNAVLDRIKPTKEFQHITELGHIDERELTRIRENYELFKTAD